MPIRHIPAVPEGALFGTKVIDQAFAATFTLDLTNYSIYSTVIYQTVLTGNVTTFTITGARNGQSIIWIPVQDGTGGRTWAPDSSIGFSATIPSVTLSTGANKADYIAFRWRSSVSKARVTAYNLGF